MSSHSHINFPIPKEHHYSYSLRDFEAFLIVNPQPNSRTVPAMSDTEQPGTPVEGKTDGKPLMTEKEQKLLAIAWQCLKTGPPEVSACPLISYRSEADGVIPDRL